MNQAFELTKLKYLNGKVEANWWSTEKDGEQTFNDGNSKNSERTPHVDLTDTLNLLRKPMRTLFEVKQKAEGQEKILITGVNLSGSEKKKTAVVTCKMLTKTGQYIAINSPQIHIESNKEIEKIIDRLETEVYDYLFKGKASQLTIADNAAA